MNYWIFKANPELYDVDKQIKMGNPPGWWKVSRYRNEMKAGDKGFLWRTGASRGIIAAVDLLSEPYFVPFISSEPYISEKYKVEMRVTAHFPVLDADFLKTIPGLENMSTFHGYQAATNFKVTQAEGEIIMKLITNQ
jgi:predicted RNA-binding protein with PUA-like domain